MIYSWETLAKIISEAHENAQQVVFTNGCFDIIHAGHVRYLNKSKKLGDLLVVGLNSDESVRQLKGESRPINNVKDRAEVLSNLKAVDYVAVFTEETPRELVEFIKPDIITKGGDYKAEDVAGGEFVLARGGKVIIVPLVEGKSSTAIINKFAGTSK